jgi:hypothetical protein
LKRVYLQQTKSGLRKLCEGLAHVLIKVAIISGLAEFLPQARKLA